MKLGQMEECDKNFGVKRHVEEVLFQNERDKHVVQVKDVVYGLTIKIVMELFLRKGEKRGGKEIEIITPEKKKAYSNDQEENDHNYLSFYDKKLDLGQEYKVRIHDSLDSPNKNLSCQPGAQDPFYFSNENQDFKLSWKVGVHEPDFPEKISRSKDMSFKVGGIRDFLFEGSHEMRYGEEEKEEGEEEAKNKKIGSFLGELFSRRDSNKTKEVEITKNMEMKPAISKS